MTDRLSVFELSNVTKYLLGSGQRLSIEVLVQNEGEDAFEATYRLKVPHGLSYVNTLRKRDSDKMIPIQCTVESPNPLSSSTNDSKTLVCDIGNPLPKGKIVRFEVILQPQLLEGSMKPKYQFSMSVNSTNPENPKKVSDNFYHMNIPIYIQTELFVQGVSQPKDIHYNTSQFQAEEITQESEIGPQVIHTYTIKNKGPADFIEGHVIFLWPSHTLSDDPMLYLMENPSTEGNIMCEVSDAVNPLNIKIDDKKRKTAISTDTSAIHLKSIEELTEAERRRLLEDDRRKQIEESGDSSNRLHNRQKVTEQKMSVNKFESHSQFKTTSSPRVSGSGSFYEKESHMERNTSRVNSGPIKTETVTYWKENKNGTLKEGSHRDVNTGVTTSGDRWRNEEKAWHEHRDGSKMSSKEQVFETGRRPESSNRGRVTISKEFANQYNTSWTSDGKPVTHFTTNWSTNKDGVVTSGSKTNVYEGLPPRETDIKDRYPLVGERDERREWNRSRTYTSGDRNIGYGGDKNYSEDYEKHYNTTWTSQGPLTHSTSTWSKKENGVVTSGNTSNVYKGLPPTDDYDHRNFENRDKHVSHKVTTSESGSVRTYTDEKIIPEVSVHRESSRRGEERSKVGSRTGYWESGDSDNENRRRVGTGGSTIRSEESETRVVEGRRGGSAYSTSREESGRRMHTTGSKEETEKERSSSRDSDYENRRRVDFGSLTGKSEESESRVSHSGRKVESGSEYSTSRDSGRRVHMSGSKEETENGRSRSTDLDYENRRQGGSSSKSDVLHTGRRVDGGSDYSISKEVTENGRSRSHGGHHSGSSSSSHNVDINKSLSGSGSFDFGAVAQGPKDGVARTYVAELPGVEKENNSGSKKKHFSSEGSSYSGEDGGSTYSGGSGHESGSRGQFSSSRHESREYSGGSGYQGGFGSGHRSHSESSRSEYSGSGHRSGGFESSGGSITSSGYRGHEHSGSSGYESGSGHSRSESSRSEHSGSGHGRTYESSSSSHFGSQSEQVSKHEGSGSHERAYGRSYEPQTKSSERERSSRTEWHRTYEVGAGDHVEEDGNYKGRSISNPDDRTFKHYQRYKRDSNFEDEFAENLQCGPVKCVKIRCKLGSFKKDQEASVTFRSRVWTKTIKKMTPNIEFLVSSQAYALVTKLPHIGRPLAETTPIASQETISRIIPSETSKADVIPLWVVVLSACAGALILMLLVYGLYKCGFFKRNRPSSAPEKQPLNRNGHYNGDEAL